MCYEVCKLVFMCYEVCKLVFTCYEVCKLVFTCYEVFKLVFMCYEVCKLVLCVTKYSNLFLPKNKILPALNFRFLDCGLTSSPPSSPPDPVSRRIGKMPASNSNSPKEKEENSVTYHIYTEVGPESGVLCTVEDLKINPPPRE